MASAPTHRQPAAYFRKYDAPLDSDALARRAKPLASIALDISRRSASAQNITLRASSNA
jgi:hypothetical protein